VLRKIIVALLATAISVGIASAAMAQDTGRYGSPFCGANAWVWAVTTPRMTIHDSPGSCVMAPSKTKDAFTVTSGGTGGFPNIASGYELGADSCPSKADQADGLCGLYPVQLGKEGEPHATVKAWMPAGYTGNIAYDDWYSPAVNRTGYSGRCAADLNDAYVEIMVWVAHPGDYPGRASDYTVRLDGRKWRVMTWETTTGCPRGEGWRLLIFEAPRVSTGTVVVHNLKLNVFSGYAIKRGWMTGGWYLDAIDVGAEMRTHGTGLAIENYTLTGDAK